MVYSPSGGTVFWGIVTNYVYDNYVKNDPPSQITVTTDGTLIKTGKYTVIVSSAVHSGTEHAKQNPAVQSGLAKTFAALDAHENVKDFGITGSISDLQTKITVPRAAFPNCFATARGRPNSPNLAKLSVWDQDANSYTKAAVG